LDDSLKNIYKMKRKEASAEHFDNGTQKEIKPLKRELIEKIPSDFAILYTFILRILSWLGIISLVYFTLYLFDIERVTTCNKSPYKRLENPDVFNTAYIGFEMRGFLSFWVIRGLLLYFAYKIWIASQKGNHVIFSLLLVFLGYFPGLIVVEQLKTMTEDMECHTKKSNGVSGHSFYITWAFLMILYLNQFLIRELKRSPKAFDILVFLSIPITTFCLGIQGFFTFWYGYHSLRQMYFGTVCGVVHSIVTIVICEVVLGCMRVTKFQRSHVEIKSGQI